MRVSTTQFALDPVVNNEEFWERIERLVGEAARDKSQLILLPEYFSLSWLLYRICGDHFRANLLRANELIPEFQRRMQTFADRYDMTIVAGTVPVTDQDKIYNRCYVFQTGIAPIYQDKINMTRFENEEWQVSSGGFSLKTFRVGEFLCAVTTCYDVEFPAVTALAAQSRVDLLLVPSCTDDVHGYWRVRHCAQARTIENQCYVMMSSIVGGNKPWSEIDIHYGQGGIYTPCDVGMPEGGVKKLGLINVEGVITEELSHADLERLRKNGTVLNLRDSSQR